MKVNPGLKSRFSERLRFPDFTAQEACELFNKQLDRDGLTLSADAQAALPGMMQKVGVLALLAWHQRQVCAVSSAWFCSERAFL